MTLKSGRYQMCGDPEPDGTYQIQKTLRDGTNIRVSQRVGDEERMWIRDKLTRLHIAGYLNEEEYQARDLIAEKAVTRPDLNRLIGDLPPHEDDWKGVREIPLGSYPAAPAEDAERAALAATSASRRHPEDLFPLFIVLGMFAFLAGAIGLDAHTTTAMTAYAGVAGFMGFISILAGVILANLRNT